ncbi:hypothetical protein CJ739_1451 [Mariniflexile rhizosphaerae]|uniref:DUF488 domain-containing protein n=1 Tax=unclassified Mariniflexile TaxID=2643887 RepID=UPI000CC5514F|nr:DUF488 domain-containing protein [Mariniflexile sp. TRM1-10]AXP80540.1 hypothetical protein CJ739_1451 [Mariniflexile sp. TRM1-10]PLB20082.1 MAG: DUF488 domain containing protein [Flavobacteriaceae bacterium FS1-H7996/R]
MNFYTIGVYNFNEKEFFHKLITNKIDVFCDIRQRRGVRGSKYSFVNSKKLQSKLNDLGIKYFHYLDLAPTTEIRELQKVADLKNHELKRDRKSLGQVFINEYKNQIINYFNFAEFLDDLKKNNANNVVLFCVEESYNACHRSIVAEKLSNDYKFNIKNI